MLYCPCNHNHTHFRFRQLQLSSEGQISDLQSELQMKVFECERIHLLQQETSRTLTGTQRERNKYMEKTEVDR